MEPISKITEPAGPVEEEDDERSLLASFRSQFPAMMHALSKLEAFGALQRGPWQTFQAIAQHWGPQSLEAWPSQETLAAYMRVTSRSVRTWTRELEELGIISIRHEPARLNAGERVYYSLGPMTRAALREQLRIRCITKRFPGPRKNSTLRDPEAISYEVKSKKQEKFSSSHAGTRELEPVAEQEEKLDVDRQTAREALAELVAKKYPRRPTPRVFDATALALATACSSSIEGGHEQKLAALRFAIAGAWTVSDGPPSARFIFGALEHFVDHVERGQGRARALERVAHSPPREAVAKPLELDERAELDDVLGMLASVGMSHNPAPKPDASSHANSSMRTPVPIVDYADTGTQ
jgi:DNA-binding MarR family transcriptional regulator